MVPEAPKVSLRDAAVSPLDESLFESPQQQQIVIHESLKEDKDAILRLRNEIKNKIAENRKLEAEITRMTKIMATSLSEKEVVKNLKREIDRQKKLLVERDRQINELMQRENMDGGQKEEIMRDLEIVRQERDHHAQEIVAKQQKILEQIDTIARQQSEISNFKSDEKAPIVKVVEKIVYLPAPEVK